MISLRLHLHYRVSFPLTIILAVVAMPTPAQECVDTIASTTSLEHYQINNDGTVTDNKHGLIWMQCSIGQIWSDGSCLGEPELVTWENAINTANKFRFAGHDGWRLPTIYELSRITELRCQQPAINFKLFPNTLSGDYWTVNSFINNASLAWRVHFKYGENHTAKKSTPAAIRLIQSVQR